MSLTDDDIYELVRTLTKSTRVYKTDNRRTIQKAKTSFSFDDCGGILAFCKRIIQEHEARK